MIARIFSLALELCLALVATATVIKRYQDYPLQVCPINAVCSEIYSDPSQEMRSSYLYIVTCKCPSGLYCPTEPGPQTLSADANTWYGLCAPVETLPRCKSGMYAEEVHEDAMDFGGRTYTKILCTCPRHERNGLPGDKAATLLAATSTNTRAARTIYHLVCNDDSKEYMTKRGRFGNDGHRSNDRSRFYFYRK